MNSLKPLLLVSLLAALVRPAVAQHLAPHHHDAPATKTVVCPVMKTKIRDTSKAPHLTVNREPVFVCCTSCLPKLKKHPETYLKQVKDPVDGNPFTVTAKTPKIEAEGALYLLGSQETYRHGLKYINTHGGHGHQEGDEHSNEATPKKEHHGHGQIAAPAAPQVQVGQQVPDFAVTDLSGTTLKLSELRKKSPSGVVSLTYWCSFCHSCRHLEKRLDEFARQQRETAAVVLIDASAGETPEGVTSFAETTDLSLPILLDKGGKTVDLFGVRATTTTLVIDANGILRYRGQFGQSPQEPAVAALKALLGGKEVPQKETPQRG